jgi:hypothetical protein
MLTKLTLVAFFVVGVHCSLFGQTFDKSNPSIVDTVSNSEHIFSRMEIIPLFKGNMKRFLADNISIDLFLRYMQPSDSLFIDTARVKFIMSKKGIISNVSISKVKSELFKVEVMRLLRLSSCNWQIGENGGRRLNGWAQFDVYFRLAKKNGEVIMNVDFMQYDPPEKPM